MLVLALVTGLSGCSTTAVQPDNSSSLYFSALYNAQAKPVTSVLLEPTILNADVILVGEWHTHPGVHLFQAELFEQLSKGNKRTALSLEQFSRADKHTLNQYVKGEIGEQYLIDNTQAWPNYKSDYRALIELAKANNSDVIAANAPKNIVTCIGRQGISYINKLDETQRTYIASTIDTSPSDYKQRFMASMHHGSPSQNQNYYAAQVTWDETMGESIVNYITAHKNTQVMHIAGDFHVKNGEGIARVIKRLAPELEVVWISPVTSVQANQTGYQLQVNALPPRYVQKETSTSSF
ncbi:ChaN family lipoprotein (plasmid) [Pseudoalteromonas espejiana]